MRDYNFMVRLNQEEIAAFRRAAKALGLPLASWARSRLIEAAQEDEAKAIKPQLEAA